MFMIKWKRPTTIEHIKTLQEAFFDEGQRAASYYTQKKHRTDPKKSYVFATELEIAIALGRDPSMFDEEQKKYGALVHDWTCACDPYMLEPIVPHELSRNWFPAILPKEGNVVFIEDAILDWSYKNN